MKTFLTLLLLIPSLGFSKTVLDCSYVGDSYARITLIIDNDYSSIDSNLLLYLPSDTQINNSDINIYYRILVDNSPLNNNITSSITNDNKFSINNINSIGEFKDTKHIFVENNPEFDLSNKDFTIEFWFYLKNSSGTPQSALINQCVGSGVEHSSYCLFLMSSKKIRLYIIEENATGYSYYIDTINTYEYNKYYHLSIVRIDTEIIFFINGIKQLVNYYKYSDNSIISSNTAIVNDLIFNKSYQPIIIGGFRQNLTQNNIIEPNYKFNGYMDQIKLTVGKSNYFDNFDVSNIYSINSDIKQVLFHQDDLMTIYIDKEEEYNLEHFNDSLVIETIQSKKNKLYVDVKVDNKIITLENNTPINCSSYDLKFIKQNDSIYLYVNDNPSKKIKAKNINNGTGLLYIGKDKNENNYNGYISKFNISKTNKYDIDLFNKHNINDTLNSKILLNDETIFNGTIDYTSTNNNFTESFTVAFYIKPNITSTTSDFYPIISEISSNGFICNIQLQYIENDGLKLQILSGNSNNTINILNNNFNNNKWSHVLLTYDNSSIISNLYINGLLVESNQGTENINLSLSNETIQIGKTLNSGEICYLKGSLKQMLLFNKVLSNNEIEQLSNIPLLYNTYAEFTGNNNIIVPYNLLNNINSNYDKFTIEFWFKDISSETGETIILNEENTFKVYYKINSNSESILGILLNNTKYEYTIDRNTYLNSWFHIAFIISDSVKLFINSDLVELVISTQSTTTSTTQRTPSIEQLGQDIDGEAKDDWSGWSVSLNADGTIVAIGAYKNDTTIAYNTEIGHVRVYQWRQFTQNDNDNNTYHYTSLKQDTTTQTKPLIITATAPVVGIYYWTQLGTEIDGEANADKSGSSISLSADGTILAIGAKGYNGSNGDDSGHVRVYQYNGSSWIQLGTDIDGEAFGDYSGESVSLSADGTIVAIGAIYNDGNGSNSGHVRVYQYNGSHAWNQLGTDIDGEAASDWSGNSVSLSADGTIVAIGARNNNANAGHVRIYQYNGSSWIQLGQDIDGEAFSDFSGGSVSLSANGTIVAIGAHANDGNGTDSGHVRIYQYNGSSSWTQLGTDIDGENESDYSGSSVSLSADGSILAIGAKNNDGNGTDSGHVRIYQYNGNSWIKVGTDIDGEATNDLSGYSVSLSADGTKVAIGAIFNDENNSNSGHVRVYKLFEEQETSSETSSETSTLLKSNIINNLNIGYYDNNYNNLSYQIKKLKLWNSERTKLDIEISYSNNDKYLEKISHLQYVNVDDLIIYIPFNIYNSYIFYKDYKIFNNNNQTINFIDNVLDIKLDNNLIKANIKTSGDDLEIINNSEIQYNNWYHIALVRDQNKINLYIDGIKNDDTLILNELNKTNNYLTIGSQGNEFTTHNYFNGFIDEIKFNNSSVYTNNFNVPTNSLLSDTSIEENYVNQILTSSLDGSYDLRDLLIFVSFNEDYNSSYTIISYKSSLIRFKTDGKTLGNLSIYSDKESFNINDLTNNDLILVNGGGNVGIGIDDPTEKLDINGRMKVNEDGIRFNDMLISCDEINSQFQFSTNYTENHTCHINTSTGQFNTGSDDRLKHNEIDINNGLNTIMKLKPQKYDKTLEIIDEDYNGDLSDKIHHKESGFIAQEVNKIEELKHLVTEGDLNKTYSLNYSGFIPYNTAAIKELKEEKDELENKVTTLENKNNELKTEIITLKTESIEQQNKVSILENQLSEILNRISTLENN